MWVSLHNSDSASPEIYHMHNEPFPPLRISEILDMDLSQLNTRLQLSVGFMLEDML